MNKFYFVVPGVLTLAFLGYERGYQKQRDADQRIRDEVSAAVRTAEEEERRNQQTVAQRDAEKRVADRDRQDKERADKKRRDYEAALALLQTQADEQAREASKLSDQIDQLSADLDRARSKRLAAERQTFELSRDTELSRVDRRNADLETQRAAT